MSRTEYFAELYEKNKNAISAQRQEKYANDERYRGEALRRTQAARDKLKKLGNESFDHNGLSVVSLESCADFLNLDVDQLRGLTKDARFPPHDKKNRSPIFTLKQAKLLKKNLRQLIANSSDANERGFEALQRGFNAD